MQIMLQLIKFHIAVYLLRFTHLIVVRSRFSRFHMQKPKHV